LNTSHKPSIERVWGVFADIEAQENLVSWRVGSVYLWPLMRNMLMREVAEQLGVFERRPPNAFVKLPASDIAFAPGDYAVVPFVRRNAAGLDPFSTFIVDSLEAHGQKPLVLGMGPDDCGSGRPQVENLEQEFIARYGNWARVLVAPTLRASHSAKYARVIAHIESELKSYAVQSGLDVTTITGPYRRFPRWLLVQFVAQRMGWQKFFKAAGVRKVFIVNAWKRSLIAGAQAAGVTVVEPQHGAISGIHPYLSWAHQDWVAYQPDEFLEWGAYWGDVANLPANTVRKVIGAPAFIADALARERELAAEGLAHQPKTVLIASQAHATQAIAEFLLEAAAANPDYLFTLKQHPQEDPIDFSEVARSLASSTSSSSSSSTSSSTPASGGQTISVPPNLILADPAASTLELMARSESVLGVYTTALFEAFAMGCNVGVLAFSGWQHIRGLVERGDAKLIENQSELTKFLTGSNPAVATGVDYYYAKPASDSDLWAAIKIAQ
jgi:hypothetical protein